MKAPWFIDGVTTDTNGRSPGSASTVAHCNPLPTQLLEERGALVPPDEDEWMMTSGAAI